MSTSEFSAWQTKFERAFQRVLGEHLTKVEVNANYVCYFEPYIDATSIADMLSYCSSFNTFSDDGHFGIVREDLVDDLDFEEEGETLRLKSIFAQSEFTYDSLIPINEIEKIFGTESVFVTMPFILKGATDGTLNDALRWCMMLPTTPDSEGFMTKSLESVEPRFQDSVASIADTQLRDHLTNFFEAQGRCSAQVVTRSMGTPGELAHVEERMGLRFVVGWINNEYGLARGIFVNR